MVAGVGTMTSSVAQPGSVGSNGCINTASTPSQLVTPTTTAVMPQTIGETGPTRTRTSENRRSNKPIMEKRRRARINNCLNELKTLILDAMKKDPARHSKLEKADILEMTVKHLETLQRQQVAMSAVSDPGVANKFRAGFTECAGEVGRFPGLDGPVKRRLLQHLANCLNGASTPVNAGTPQVASTETTTTTSPPLQVHIVRTAPTSEAATHPTHSTQTSNIIFTNTNGQGLQLVPTRLPNGDIALILPSSNSFRTARTVQTTPSTSPSPSISSTSSGSSPLPMLIPIPNRAVQPSKSPSPVAFDRLSVNPISSTRQITILTQTPGQRIIIPAKEGVKNIPLLATVPQVSNIYYDEPKYRQEIETNVRDIPEEELQPNNIREYSDDSNRSEIVEDYSKRVYVPQDAQLSPCEPSQEYVSSSRSYSPENRETLLHIPERDYYDERYSPIQQNDSPINYTNHYDSDSYSERRYVNYVFNSEQDQRCYSPEMQKPLALVTNRKRYDDVDLDDQPWRPW